MAAIDQVNTHKNKHQIIAPIWMLKSKKDKNWIDWLSVANYHDDYK